MRSCCFCLLTGALLGVAAGPLAAQQGAIAGRVTDAITLDPVPRARISVVGGGPLAAVTSESNGSFELELEAGIISGL